MSASAVSLRLRRLVIGHGTVRVAGPIDAVLPGGRLHVLAGPNGCGKTTLLRTLLGLQPPLEGSIDAEGLDLRAYVPQSGSFDEVFPVTVSEVVAMAAPPGLRRRARHEAVREALRGVDALELARRRFSRLSGGQRQRVLLARALVGGATLLACDEPTTGLDAGSGAAVWRLLSELARDPGRLVIVVTHDLHAVAAIEHRAWLFAEGGVREAEAVLG